MFHVALYTLFSYRTRNVFFLTQAGTDTGGYYMRKHTRAHAYTHRNIHTISLFLPPSPQQKSKHVKRKKVCCGIDQNPWKSVYLRLCHFDLESVLKEFILMF